MDNIYHGLIINISQKNRSAIRELHILGCRKIYFGLIKIFKVEVPENKITATVKRIQENMTDRMGFVHKEWYAHFYRNDELIVVFRQKIFRTIPHYDSWGEIIAYGKSLNIPEKQLDFSPCRFEDEVY